MRSQRAMPVLLGSAVLMLALCAGAPAAGEPSLTSADVRVPAGEVLVVRGRGFPADVHVTLLAGKRRAKVEPIGAARTGRRGGFVARITIERDAAAGRYLAVACHDRCRNEATLRFRVLRP
jgi:hypothetical protein